MNQEFFLIEESCTCLILTSFFSQLPHGFQYRVILLEFAYQLHLTQLCLSMQFSVDVSVLWSAMVVPFSFQVAPHPIRQAATISNMSVVLLEQPMVSFRFRSLT